MHGTKVLVFVGLVMRTAEKHVTMKLHFTQFYNLNWYNENQGGWI